MKKKTSVLILYTGGTIGMAEDAATGALVPFDFRHLSGHIPELAQFVFRYNVEFETHAFEKPMDSSNMNPAVWVRIAKVIESYYDRCDGFVVLHGTDTMAYSASALSFLLENLAKPVIFTGSQLPVSSVRTDAKANLLTAIQLAASKEVILPEVCIYFGSRLLRGNRTHKSDAEKFRAFESGNYPTLAEAGVNVKYNTAAIAAPGKEKLVVHTAMDAGIVILKIFPGITESITRAILSAKDLRAVVLETFGSGNTMTDAWFPDCLREAVSDGITVLNIAQCEGGSVDQGKYETSSALNSIGVISGRDLTTEAAVTKLMFLLGLGLTGEELKRKLQTSLRGEMND